MNNQQDTPSEDTGQTKQPGAEHERVLLERERLESTLRLFNTLHPADQGDVLVELPRDSQQELLSEMSPEGTADILEHLPADEAVRMSKQLQAPVLAVILDETSPDVLRNIPTDQFKETLEAMEEAEDVIPLLQYADDTAGGLMSSDYVAVREDITAGAALDSVRLQSTDVEHTDYVLAVDVGGRLVGSVGVARLVLARLSARVRDIMESDAISATAQTDQEHCARLVQRYELSALPVVDSNGLLLGVIFREDLVDVLVQEATEDMYRMAAVEGERVFGPLLNSVRSRLPWLYINLATTFLAALVIALFESSIAKVVALAVFLPIVPGQGGMGGIQTLTVVVRSMAIGVLPGRRWTRLIARGSYLGPCRGWCWASRSPAPPISGRAA